MDKPRTDNQSKKKSEFKNDKFVNHVYLWTRDSSITVEEARGLTQRAISQKVDKYCSNKPIEEAESERDKARINSLSISHVGDWLNTVPFEALGLNLRPRVLITSEQYRLGLKVYDSSGECIACGQRRDEFGDHSIVCSSEGERIFRHNTLRDAI